MISRRDDLDDDRETVLACPCCDSSNCGPRQPQKPASRSEEISRWFCRSCGSRFDKPQERPARSDTGPTNGSLAHELLKADPDDVCG